MAHSAILKPGVNCWRIEHADRAAFLVDGAEFFRAFRETVKQAQRSVLIIAWDIDSRIDLVREGKPDGLPGSLGAFLNCMVQRNSQLHIHVLDWDFTMIFAPAREWMPLYKQKWNGHPQLHFFLDDQHPTGACHHQKIIVVDDQVAFVGGLDLTTGRWDTPEHLPDDPRRRDLEAEPVPQPYHDIQMLVRGPVAALLGDIARERWFRATGQKLTAPERQADASYWPGYLAPDVENVQVAIARTIPRYKSTAEVREVERLLLDAIAAARNTIYIEAQYFTADKIGAALAKRLEEQDGPEIVVVLPEHTDGWLSQNTMDVLRERLFRRLKASDHQDHFRLYYPCIPKLDGKCVNVHSKMIIIDDQLARVGSANLNNRSMGLDTECDLVLEANGEAHVRHAIAAFRNRLLGEHLGVEPSEIAARLAQEGSLIRAIESLRGSPRTLFPLPFRVTADMDALVPDSQVIDPDQPMDADQLIDEYVPEEKREPARYHIYLIASILAAILGLATLWHWSPLREWVNVETMVGFAAEFEQARGAPLFALGVFLIGGLIAFPLTVLIIACVLVFGPWQGFLYSLIGALLSAMSTYALGHLLGRNTVRRFAGKKIRELNKRLAYRGIMTIIIVRIIPLAPFSVINMIAGASQIRFRDFVIGSAIGLLPGMAGISLFTDRLAATIQKPDLPAFAVLATVIAIIIVSGWTFWRWEERQRNSRLRARAD
jgi:phospholipase D1/2